MKKTVILLLAVCLLVCSFAGCKGSAAEEYDMPELAQKLLDSTAFSDFLNPVTLNMVGSLYKIDVADVEDCVVYCSSMATTEEIGIFKCVSEAAAGRILEAAKARAVSQEDIYKSYAPAEPPKLQDAYIQSNGVYVFYIVANDASVVADIMK